MKLFVVICTVLASHVFSSQNISCGSKSSCSSCLNVQNCAWCLESSKCVSHNKGSCSSAAYNSCASADYVTIIIIVVFCVVICFCFGLYYWRKHWHRDDENIFLTPLTPAHQTREFIWGKENVGKEWMCIICGFDNKQSSKHCMLCGTSLQFNVDYKSGKLERQKIIQEHLTKRKVAKEKRLERANAALVREKLLMANTVVNESSTVDSIRNGDTSLNPMLNRYIGVDAKEEGEEKAPDIEVGDVSTIPPTERKGPSVGFSLPAEPTTSRNSLNSNRGSNDLEASYSSYSQRANLSLVQRLNAFNFRRLNQLSLRQKSARRRKVWQRKFDEQTGQLQWVRMPASQAIKYKSSASSGTEVSFNSYFAGASANGLDSHANALLAAAQAGQDDGNPGDNNRPRTNSGPQKHNPILDDSFELPGFTSNFDEDGNLQWEKVEHGDVAREATNPGRTLASNYVVHGRKVVKSPKGAAEVPSLENGGDVGGEVTTDNSRANSTEVNEGEEMVTTTQLYTLSPPPVNIASLSRLVTQDISRDSLSSTNSGPISGNVAGSNTAAYRHGAPRTVMTDPFGNTARSQQNATASSFRSLSNFPYQSSSFEEDLEAIAALSFREKQLWFLLHMSRLQKPWTDGCVLLEVSRKKVLQQSHNALMTIHGENLHKWFRIQFHGEPGVDAGGLSREWFQLITAELLAPSSGLFVTGSGASMGGSYHFNPLSGKYNPNHLSYFRFAGRIFGKALMEQQPIAATLCLPIRKQLLSVPITFSDLEFLDSELYRNLQFLQQNEHVEELSLDFTVMYQGPNGISQTYELKPGGSGIPVTDDNKDEYLLLRLKHRMFDSVKSQLECFMKGFFEIIPPPLLTVFDYQELDLLLCGVPELDVNDWKQNTEYLAEFAKKGVKHKVIKWFWEVVEAMTAEERVRLLQFVTGSSRLPAQGFRALQSNEGKFRRFNIQSISKKDAIYPRAHTCFNKLDLPLYDTKAELEAYLSVVINMEIVGFSMD